jgi:hypothetical protein
MTVKKEIDLKKKQKLKLTPLKKTNIEMMMYWINSG